MQNEKYETVTLELDDSLYKNLEKQASEAHLTIDEYVEKILADALQDGTM